VEDPEPSKDYVWAPPTLSAEEVRREGYYYSGTGLWDITAEVEQAVWVLGM